MNSKDLVVGFLAALSALANAQGHMNMQGASGLLNVPDASVLEYGTATIARDNQVDGYYAFSNLNATGNDIKFAVGAFPHVEMLGRNLTTTTTQGPSDLSFNIKLQLPWEILPGLSLAVGELDFGGSVNLYDTKYAVATWQYGPVRTTLGAGSYDGEDNNITGRLDGVFAGIEFQATDWLSILLEDDVDSINTGVRLSTPASVLPPGWQASMTWMLSQEEGVDDRQDWYGFNLKIPLAQEYQRIIPKNQVRVAPAVTKSAVFEEQYGRDQLVIENPLIAPPQPSEAPTPRNLVIRENGEQALTRRFLAADFEKVRVQQYGREWVIAFENVSLNNNVIDALAVAAGVAATTLPQGDRFYLQMEKFGIPVFGLGAEVGAWGEFLEGNGGLPESIMVVAPSSKLRNRNREGGFLVTSMKNTWDYMGFRPTVIIKPLISSTIGTDNGIFDYSLAARADVVLPLWPGAAFNISRDWSVDESKDYTQEGIYGGVFYNNRITEGVKDRVLSQTIRHGSGFTSMISYGRFFGVNDGVSLESRWEPGDGRHRFRIIATDFEYKHDSTVTRNAKLASYRYFWQSTNSELNVTAGDFYNEDSGYRLDFAQHVGDTKLHLIYQKSEGTAFAGLGITLPLTPRKGMGRVAGVHIEGAPSWHYEVNTVVGEDLNRLVFGPNIIPTEYFNLRNGYFNGDRLSPAYVRANRERLREAWEMFGAATK
jgi:hypothetical protein